MKMIPLSLWEDCKNRQAHTRKSTTKSPIGYWEGRAKNWGQADKLRLLKILKLDKFLESEKIDYSKRNIEEIYDEIYTNDPNSPVLQELNERIIQYFSGLQIPEEVTL